MRSLIVACRTVEDELRAALARLGSDIPVVFLNAGLHIFPDKLREAVQTELDRIENVDTVLMGYGFCGKGLVGIRSDRFRIVVPRVHDCISLLLGSHATRANFGHDVFFITQGWLGHELGLVHEYEQSVARYGEERALRLTRRTMQNYTRLAAIDTGAYDVDSLEPQVADLAGKLGWQFEKTAGSLRFFEKLITGPWDEEFVVLEPGQTITLDDMLSLPAAE